MKKTLNQSTLKLRLTSFSLAIVFIISMSGLGVVVGEEKVKDLQQIKKPLSKEFVSENSMYKVRVNYEKWGGQGKAYYTIRNKNDEAINNFTTEMAPYEIYVSNNGKRIIAFGGDWTEIAFINKMIFYDFNGNIIKKYEPNIPIKPYMTAIQLSKEGNIFIMGLWYDLIDYLNHLNKNKMIHINILMLFDVVTGNIIRQFPVKDVETARSRITVSRNAEWIILSGPTNKGWDEKIILLDKNGKKHWEKLWRQRTSEGSFVINGVSSDGKCFEFEEHRRENIKKFIYSNTKGKVKLEEIIDIKRQKD